jgi:glutamate-1-semialdehyde 2,1-aminomutase
MGTRSQAWFERAKKVIPGGVNSPVRAFCSVGGIPPFIVRGFGSKIWDEDGNEYVDYVGSWGPLILGHAHPIVVEAVKKAASNGLTFGAATAKEVELAEKIQEAFPKGSLEKLRLVNSGTEAAMTAVRLARAYTGKNKVLKFEGCYHGHADSFLVKAGSGLLTFGNPSSKGIPGTILQETIVAQYNNIESVKEGFEKFGSELACVIVEPVAGNMGVVLPKKGFLESLKELCQKFGVVLIFDEVITGFRLCYGGFQNLVGIIPDLTILGKIIGGGMPIGAVGGKHDILSLLAPEGPVYQAGTLSGNPVAVSAGLATLEVLFQNKDIYTDLDKKGSFLEKEIKNLGRKITLPLAINRAGSIFTVFFHKGPVETYEDVCNANTALYKLFFHALLEEGVYVSPSAFEAWFVSMAHSEEDLHKTLLSIEKSFSKVMEASPALHE